MKIIAGTVRDELARLADRLKQDRTNTDQTKSEMRALVALARDAGISYNEIERITGLAAETVRRWAERG